MLGKVKNLLGIESVKLRIELPETEYPKSGIIKGKLIISSLSKQIIKSINIKLIEKYQRGRNDNKLISEYTAGIVEHKEAFKIEEGKDIAFEFELPYEIAQSEMDKIGSSNFIFKGIIKAAKYFHSVKSEFRIEATAEVQGNAISPLTSCNIILKS